MSLDDHFGQPKRTYTTAQRRARSLQASARNQARRATERANGDAPVLTLAQDNFPLAPQPTTQPGMHPKTEAGNLEGMCHLVPRGEGSAAKDPYHQLISSILRQAVTDAAGIGFQRHLSKPSALLEREKRMGDARAFLYNKERVLEMWCGLADTDWEMVQRALLKASGLPEQEDPR